MYKSGDTVSLNREAKYNYFIEDTFEAGIELREMRFILSVKVV